MGIRMDELMEHEKFEMPEMEIVNLSMEDVVTTSPACEKDFGECPVERLCMANCIGDSCLGDGDKGLPCNIGNL